MRLEHAALVCGSQKKAETFYQGILGLRKAKSQTLDREMAKKIFDQPFACDITLYKNQDLAVEVFVPHGEVEIRPGGFSHLCLKVDDREAFMEACRDAGLEVRRIPRGDGFLVFVKDFDGNLFEIKGREKP